MELVRYTGEEWSALYIDGKLDTVGDHYLIEERISSIAGVDEVHSDDFMRGGWARGDVAPTLDDVYAYATTRLRAEKDAEIARLKKIIYDSEQEIAELMEGD